MFLNITSIAGLVTFPFDSLYHTVKVGLQAFSEGLSYELAPFGIAVKTVAPGFIRTGFGAGMVVTSIESYADLRQKSTDTVHRMMDPTTQAQHPKKLLLWFTKPPMAKTKCCVWLATMPSKCTGDIWKWVPKLHEKKWRHCLSEINTLVRCKMTVNPSGFNRLLSCTGCLGCPNLCIRSSVCSTIHR